MAKWSRGLVAQPKKKNMGTNLVFEVSWIQTLRTHESACGFPCSLLPLGIISIIVDDPDPIGAEAAWKTRRAKKRLFPFRWVPDVASWAN